MPASATPLSGNRPFIADGGLETTLIFRDGIELPHFAAFVLLRDETGVAALRAYYEPYLAIARARDVGFVYDTPTWRASADWGERPGYSAAELDAANRQGVALRIAAVAERGVNGRVGRTGCDWARSPVVIAPSGRSRPRGAPRAPPTPLPSPPISNWRRRARWPQSPAMLRDRASRLHVLAWASSATRARAPHRGWSRCRPR